MDNTLNFSFLSEALKNNPRSSLFAIYAKELISRGENAKAISLLEGGTKLFPNYAISFFILGECFKNINEIQKSKSAFQSACDLSPFNQKFRTALNEVIEILENENSFLTFEQYAQKNITNYKKSDILTFEQYLKLKESTFELDKFVTELSRAQRIVVDENQTEQNIYEPENNEELFLTPTLAEIFVEQNQFDEAISLYQKLSEILPTEKDKFLKRLTEIEELKSQIKKST
ncbi:MAG: tetratricopeptide repeat protein [Bacteroidota bacterium]